MSELKNYVVYACPNCHLIQMSRCDRKTRKCFRCNRTLSLNWSKIKILFSSDSSREAIEAVKRLKIEQVEYDPTRVFVRSSLLRKNG
ncbi:DUF1922 domain-containing protein [Candidatus Bathyarchaeota archaeon]|nr:DUF1922 domain-containing protein [Candidatus Bathyarchaeota archaeon]